MEHMKLKLDGLRELYLKYKKSDKDFDIISEEMENFKINFPLIGGFSSGKSSIINALLGEKILRTNITPETAIATEIEYSEEEFVRMYQKNKEGKEIFLKEITLEEFKNREFNIEECSKVSVGLNNKFLKKNKEIRIVDMPGLDSGILAHNNAIDSYIGSSIAYLVVCDAEQGTVRKSILDFLEELKSYKKPIYSVVNKIDKIGKQESINGIIEECQNKIEEVVGKKLEISGVSARKKEISAIEKYMIELNSQSNKIFEEYFNSKLLMKKEELKKYLETIYHNIGKDTEEIEKEIRDFEQKLESLEKVFSGKYDELKKSLRSSSSKIKIEIQNKLNSSVDNLAYSLLNGGDISSEINQIIRTTVATELNSNVEANIEKFLSEIAKDMQISISATPIDSKTEIDGKTIATLQTAVTAVTTAILTTTVGLGAAVAGPIGIAVGIVVGLAIKMFSDKSAKEKQCEESKSKIRSAIPEIVSNVEDSINRSFNGIASEIKDKIKIEMAKEKTNILEALEVGKNKLKKEQEEEEKEKKAIYDDIEMLKI